ncbi:LamG-like jellyroll fold domain-containing protein [Paraglaciecola aestuariivivens]
MQSYKVVTRVSKTKLANSILCLILLSVFSSLAFSQAVSVPLVEYRFDELEYGDVENEIIDSTSGLHGRAKSSQPATGKICNAIDLSATGTSDYAVLHQNALNGQGNFTISVWAKTSTSRLQTILSGAGTDLNDLIMVLTNNTTFTPYLKSTYYGDISINSVSDNQWHHLVWTRKNAQSCFYLNGVLMGCLTQTSAALQIQSLILGQEQDSLGGGFEASQAFDGLLDELLIYDSALTARQIDTLYNYQNAGLNYDGSARSCLDPSPVALYEFEQESWSNPGDILDSTTNANHASPVGGVAPLKDEPNQISCRVLDVPKNLSNTQYDAIDTGIDPNNLDNKGTISFWYKSNENWNSGNHRFLFDASEVTSSAPKRFYLAINNSGALQFGLQDTGGGQALLVTNNLSYSANQWVHVAAAWDLSTNQYAIYLNGVAATIASSTNSITNTTLGNVDTLYVGDNRSPYFSNAGNSANGQIDNLRVYRVFQKTLAITADMNDVTTCHFNPIAEYRFDEFEYSDVENEVIDSISGLNGRAKLSQPVPGKVCNAVDLSVNSINDYVILNENTLTGQSDFSVSMWVKTSKTAVQSMLSGAGASDNDLLMFFSNSQTFTPFLKGASNGSVSTTNIADNSWHHLVWTRQGDQSCLYFDKTLMGCVTQSSNALSIQSLILGQEQDNVGGGFDAAQAYDGLIDELLIFHYALDLTGVSDVFDNQNAGLGYDGSLRICPDPDPEVFYQFEQQSWTTAGDVIDSSDNLYDGDPIGAVNPIFEELNQKSCQALDVPSNISSTEFAAVNTGFDPNTFNTKGTISFWYKSNENWNSGNHRYLFDASDASATNPAYFLMTIHNSGELLFALQDDTGGQSIITTNAYTFSADEWVHIAASWDLQTNSYAIFVNGAQATIASNSNSIASSVLGELASLYIGDNRSNYFSNYGNSANGQFDDFRIYNYPQTAEQVNNDANALSPCSLDLLSHYQFEQESWPNAGDVLDSSVNAYNGTAIGNNVSSILKTDQIACRYLDVPQNTSATSFDAIDTGIKASTIGNKGTISFWYRSNEAWNSGNARQFFDASTQSASNPDPNKHFFMALTSTGQLQFSLEDKNDKHMTATTNNSFDTAADTWTHIAVSWSLPDRSVQILVNAVPLGITYDKSSSLHTQISDTATLYLGDNRTNYFQFDSTGNSANGQFDDVRIYQVVQSTAAISQDMNDTESCQAVDHYRIEHDTKGFTCEAEAITIKACADETCSTLYSTAASITLSPSGWSGGDTITFTEQINTTLSVTDAGTITFTKSTASPEADLRCFNGSVETCNMEFVDDGFEFSDANGGASLPDQLAEANITNVNLRAIRNNNGVCQGLLAGEQDVTLIYDCDDPNVCQTPFAGIAVAGDGSGESSGTVRLNFDINGVASLSGLSYADAGRVKIKAEAEINNVTFTATTNGEPIDFYPSYLALSVTDTALNYSATANENNYIAGKDFTLVIGAYGVNDGLLPNYQIKDSRLKVSRLAPDSGGANGTFRYANSAFKLATLAATFETTNNLTFSGGEYRYANAYYSEVGRIEIDAQDNDYLGNQINSNGSLVLGNFFPAYFDLAVTTQPVLADTCSAFSYLGEEIDFATDPVLTMTAYNALDQITQNYTASTTANNNSWNYFPTQSLLNSALSYVDSSTYTSTGTASVMSLGDAPIVSDNNGFDGSGKRPLYL